MLRAARDRLRAASETHLLRTGQWPSPVLSHQDARGRRAGPGGFPYIDPGMGTPSELHSWGAAHRGLWAKLRQSGRRVEVVAVAWEQHLLDRAERVLQSWTVRDMSEAEIELLALRQAVAQADGDTVERYGGLNAALKKINQLAQENPVSNGRGMIDDFRLWGSRRCRRINAPLTKT